MRIESLFFRSAVGSLLALCVGCGRGDRSEHPKYICRVNLAAIEGAIATWAFEHKKTTNDIVTWSDIVGTNAYIRAMPMCPRGGTYTITRVGELPTCSIPEDTAYFKSRTE